MIVYIYAHLESACAWAQTFPCGEDEYWQGVIELGQVPFAYWKEHLQTQAQFNYIAETYWNFRDAYMLDYKQKELQPF